ncbi:MAG: hypothetical protein SFX73_26770 [Kofleriaceae bacterium]|nr:hypothetical protein [Kofleriaceae bacterium]
MSESFVDLSYRGLSLGRRIKLTRVHAASGYLEMPAPMPVGTSIAIATDEGLTLEATVTRVHEQVGGATIAPGMQVAPKLEGDEIVAWWEARVASTKAAEEAAAAAVAERAPVANDAHVPVIIVPSASPAPSTPSASPAPSTPPPAGHAPPREPAVVAAEAAARPDRVTVRPRSHTVPTPPPAGAVADAAEWASDLGKAAAAVAAAMAPAPPQVHPSMDHGATTVMQAVDPAALGLEEGGVVRDSSQMDATLPHSIVDDGKMTTVMSAVDPAALGLEVTESGQFVAATEETTDVGAAPTDDKKAGGSKKRKKRKS